jgi:hypothetical protein
MTWFYNSYSGELTSASGADALAYEAAIHTGTGWHELPIPASDTAAEAEAYVEKNFPGGTQPTTSVSTGLSNATTDNPITQATGISSTLQGLAKISAFLEALTHADTWRSLGWLVLGIALMGLGVWLWMGHPMPSVLPVPL